jgi:hypothetical protein
MVAGGYMMVGWYWEETELIITQPSLASKMGKMSSYKGSCCFQVLQIKIPATDAPYVFFLKGKYLY